MAIFFLKETLSFRDMQNDMISRIYFIITPREDRRNKLDHELANAKAGSWLNGGKLILLFFLLWNLLENFHNTELSNSHLIINRSLEKTQATKSQLSACPLYPNFPQTCIIKNIYIYMLKDHFYTGVKCLSHRYKNEYTLTISFNS